jgi:hypothetical protein
MCHNFLPFVNNAAMNMDIQMSFQVPAFNSSKYVCACVCVCVCVFVCIYIVLFAVLRFELRASCLLGALPLEPQLQPSFEYVIQIRIAGIIQ